VKISIERIEIRYHDKEKPNQAKLELFAVLRQPEPSSLIEKVTKQELDGFWVKRKADI
jgi:hypothetical protein